MDRDPKARWLADEPRAPTEAEPRSSPQYTIRQRNRYWEVRDPSGELVCLTVYKRGAVEVVRRLYA